MSVKIDRFQIDKGTMYQGSGVMISDYSKKFDNAMATFTTGDDELDMKLANIVLDELNKVFEDE